MSCYRVFFSQGAKMMCPVTSAEEYREMRNCDEHVLRVASVRSGNRDMKSSLMQMNYSCIPGENMKLAGVKTASNSVGMDIDFDPDDPDYDKKMAEVPSLIISKAKEVGLLMLERSVNKGYHVVFKRRFFDGLDDVRKNQERNLRWASEVLGVQFDKNAKDITRVFFTTTASDEDLLFLDDGLFLNEAALEGASMAAENPTARDADASRTGTDGMTAAVPAAPAALAAAPTAAPTAAPAVAAAVIAADADAAVASEDEDFSEDYQGIPYKDIVAKYWVLFNNGKEPCVGDRNMQTFELAKTLRSICDYKQAFLEKVIDRYDGLSEEEWHKTIANAIKDESQKKGMPYRLKQILRACKEDRKLKYLAVGAGHGDDENDANVRGAKMPERPKKMPKFLKLVSSKVSDKYKAMVEEAIWPAVCAHLKGVKFQYIDGCEHEANISSPLIGRQGIGKGCINKPIEVLLEDITERDRQNEMRERQWRQRNQGKGASKDRQPRPDDLIFQRLDFDLTPAALSQALIDAEKNGGRRIITKVDEIEMLGQVGNGKNDTVGLLIRYAFDNARWGQKRVGLDSVNGSYTVRWVWNASCTRKSAHKFITPAWVANGTLSRLNLNTILVPKGNEEISKIGEYDDNYTADMRTYVEKLNAANGLVSCQEADKLAQAMLKEHNDIADMCESEGYRVFSYRAIVIGWLKANLLYILNDYKWDKSIAKYVKYSVRRDMWVKFYHFGDEIESEFEDDDNTRHALPQNMLSLLPDEFTLNEYLTMRQEQGRTGAGKSTLRMWKQRGYIDFDDVSGRYVKKVRSDG